MKKEGKLFKKVFIVISAVFILTLIGIYSYRLIHFYLLENGTGETGTVKKYFTDKLKRTINVSDLSGGLYIIEDEYIYKFNANKNYLWYSGQLWRMLKINDDKTIDIVMDDSLTILNASNGEEKYVDDYLKDFYSKLDQEFLVSVSYCNDKFDNLDDIKCKDKVSANISLLDIYTYHKAGGNASFLNNNSYFWLVSENIDGNNWYINSDGSLAVSEKVNSFGIRPVVRLKNELNVISGDGSKENPYIIKEKKNNNLNVGEYIKFNNSLWRINDLNDKGIVISSEDCLSLDGKCILKSFGNTNVYEKSSLYKYLNEEYYNYIVDKEFIIKNSFGIGDYIDYNYNNTTLKNVEAYVGISKIGDYYISNKIDTYLLTANDRQAIYTINKNGSYYLDFPSGEKVIYPVLALDINLNINSGDGTKNNPYILSR